jgi:hypothetical protein
MASRVNYIALLIIVTIGVTAGNLLSNWIIASYLSAEVENASVEISKALSKKKKNQKIINKPIKPMITEDVPNQQLLIEQRKQDKDGIRLANNCSEWTLAHNDMQTQASERGMKKHCGQYEDYIKTGELPRHNLNKK